MVLLEHHTHYTHYIQLLGAPIFYEYLCTFDNDIQRVTHNIFLSNQTLVSVATATNLSILSYKMKFYKKLQTN